MKNILTLCMFFACCSSVQATMFYVDNTHASKSDAGAGTDSTAPWGTVQRACTTLVAGDSVWVMGNGNTYDEASPLGTIYTVYIDRGFGNGGFRRNVNVGYTPKNSGNDSDGTITFKGWPGYSRPKLVGGTTPANRFASVWTGLDYIKFDSLHFESFYVGIFFNAGYYDSLVNCEINDIGYEAHSGSNGGAVFIDGYGGKGNVVGFYAAGNYIHDVWPDNSDNPEAVVNDTITTAFNGDAPDSGNGNNGSAFHIYYCDSCQVEYNWVERCAYGIFFKGQVDMMNSLQGTQYGTKYQYGGVDVADSNQENFNIEINNNFVRDCATAGIELGVQGQYDSVLIHHNIVMGNTSADIRIAHWYGSQFRFLFNFARNVYIYNNTTSGYNYSGGDTLKWGGQNDRGSWSYGGTAGILINLGRCADDTLEMIDAGYTNIAASFRPNGLADNFQVFNNLDVNRDNTFYGPGRSIVYPMLSTKPATFTRGVSGAPGVPDAITYCDFDIGVQCMFDEVTDQSGISNFFEGHNASWIDDTATANFIAIGEQGQGSSLRTWDSSHNWKANVPAGCTDCSTNDTTLTVNPVNNFSAGDMRLTDSTTYLSTGGRGTPYSDTIGANWNAADIFTLYAEMLGASCVFGHSMTAIDTQLTTITIRNDYSYDTDSTTLDSLELVWDDDAVITSPLGSVVVSTGMTDPDTLQATGLSDGTQYWFWWITYTADCGADTSNSITVTTPTPCVFTHSLVAVETTTTSVTVANTYTFDADSSAIDSVQLIWDDDSDIGSPLGNVVDQTNLGSPDTLAVTGLTASTQYWFWYVIYQSKCGADTSSSITRTTEAVAAVSSSTTINGGVTINGGTTLYMRQPEVPKQ